MADIGDLLDIAGDILENQDLDKMMKQGSQWLKKFGVDLNNLNTAAGQPGSQPQNPSAGSLAEERMRKEKQAGLKSRLQAKFQNESRLQPEPMVPETMTPEAMTPENVIPEGESALEEGPLIPPKMQESESVRFLTHICNQGLRGAMITNEILEPPLALRQGYLARYRRRMR